MVLLADWSTREGLQDVRLPRENFSLFGDQTIVHQVPIVSVLMAFGRLRSCRFASCGNNGGFWFLLGPQRLLVLRWFFASFSYITVCQIRFSKGIAWITPKVEIPETRNYLLVRCSPSGTRIFGTINYWCELEFRSIFMVRCILKTFWFAELDSNNYVIRVAEPG